jgi:O-antigen ligase
VVVVVVAVAVGVVVAVGVAVVVAVGVGVVVGVGVGVVVGVGVGVVVAVELATNPPDNRMGARSRRDRALAGAIRPLEEITQP